MQERWIALLNYWQRNQFRHALTFPFLVGALRTPIGAANSPVGNARKELDGLVKTMSEHRANGYFHHVYRCPTLGQLVVTSVAGLSLPPSAIAIPPAQPNVPPSLYASDGVNTDSNSPISTLVEAIWKETGSAIEDGRFSCRGEQFWTFNDYELRAIRAALF